MTQNAENEVVIPLLDDDNANPYNANKSYHVDDKPGVSETADAMFIPQRQEKETVKDVEQDSTPQDKTAEDNHDYKKRWSDLKQKYDTATREYREALDKEKEGDTLANVKVPETTAELEAFMKEEPKLYEMFKGIAKIEVQEDSQEVKNKLSEIEERETKLAKAQALKEIKDYHKDFDEVTNSDDFHNWAEAQPKAIQDMVYNTTSDSSVVIRAIDLYKADVAKLEQGESAKLTQSNDVEDASSIVSTRPSSEPNQGQKKIWSESEIRRLPMDEYDRLQEEIDLAVFEGRVVAG